MTIVVRDLRQQADAAPRLLPLYYAGNPLGYNRPRPFRDYGAPHYGGLGSNIMPPISDEEFRSHFMFGSDKIVEVLTCLKVLLWFLPISHVALFNFHCH